MPTRPSMQLMLKPAHGINAAHKQRRTQQTQPRTYAASKTSNRSCLRLQRGLPDLLRLVELAHVQHVHSATSVRNNKPGKHKVTTVWSNASQKGRILASATQHLSPPVHMSIAYTRSGWGTLHTKGADKRESHSFTVLSQLPETTSPAGDSAAASNRQTGTGKRDTVHTFLGHAANTLHGVRVRT
jgi:hypothetical protein